MNSIKYLGTVKWFGNESTGGNYGFISHEQLGELFFHGRNVKSETPTSSICPGLMISFISEPSKKHAGKLEATEVQALSKETDPSFLLTMYLDRLLKAQNISTDHMLMLIRNLYQPLKLQIDSAMNKKLLEVFVHHETTKLTSIRKMDMTYLSLLLNTFLAFLPRQYRWYSNFVGARVSSQVYMKLWLGKYLLITPIDDLANSFLSQELNIQTKILDRCEDFEKTTILLMIVDKILVEESEQFTKIRSLLIALKTYNLQYYNLIFSRIENQINAEILLLLWLEEFHDRLDLETYKQIFHYLSNSNQQLFVKKLLSRVSWDNEYITVKDFIELHNMWANFTHDNTLPADTKLDYSTGIMLYVISELSKEQTINSNMDTRRAQSMIFDLILNNIKDPAEILQITGYFDECQGRCSLIKKVQQDERDEVIISYELKRNPAHKARNHPICDGRKAIGAKDGQALLDLESGKEYWWCANQKCFESSRQLHNKSNWKSFSLMDFLHILDLKYSEIGLEMYLNVINKTNRFLEHMKCRECQHILYPKGKSAYAFYGVNLFHCQNHTCAEKEAEIYISHCLNGKCDMTIDSRDAVKCKPAAHDQNCGWYICIYCNACCSTSQLRKRKYRIEHMMQRPYTCHTVGHKELGILCCNSCGSEMNKKVFDPEKYQTVLNWFIAHKNDKEYISSSGENHSKRWFLYKQGKLSDKAYQEKLKNLKLLGFRVNPSHSPQDFFVSEGGTPQRNSLNIFICTNPQCGKILDLTKDVEQLVIVQYYHESVFQT